MKITCVPECKKELGLHDVQPGDIFEYTFSTNRSYYTPQIGLRTKTGYVLMRVGDCSEPDLYKHFNGDGDMKVLRVFTDVEVCLK